jgi:hypothetical protein
MARRGRPPREWRWLVHDVDCVKEQRHCGVLTACGYLADGAFSETLHVWFGGQLGKCKVVWGKWKGMDVQTLERKYYWAKAQLNGRHKIDLTKFPQTF